MKKYIPLFIALLLSITNINGYAAEEKAKDAPSEKKAPAQIEQEKPKLVTPEQAQAGEGKGTSSQYLRLTEQKIAPDLQCILDRKRIDVAIFEGDVPPFFMKNKNGELTGLDASIAKHLADELGVKVSFVRVNSFNDVVKAVVEGKADVGISKLSVTLERAKQVQYTGRYVSMGKALLVNRILLKKFQGDHNSSLEEVFKMEGAKIGVIANSSFVQFAERIFPQAELVEYKDWNSAVKDVVEGNILAIFRDEWEIRKVMADIPAAPLKTQAIIVSGEIDPLEMVVPWNSDQLARFIDKFVEINNYNFDVKSLTKMYKNYNKTDTFRPIN